MENFDEFVDYCVAVCGSYYDETDDFVTCPECGEPIYREDWVFEDYCDGKDRKCPICETIL